MTIRKSAKTYRLIKHIKKLRQETPKALKKHLFEPRFHFSRFQLNLFTLIVISVGFTTGTILTAMRVIPIIKAFNDTQKVWNMNVSTASDYTTASLMTIDDNGAQVVTAGQNRYQNAGFEDGADFDNNWSAGFNLDIDRSTFTAKVSSRNGGGPFAAAPYIQGDPNNTDALTDDILYVPQGSQISGNFYANFDTNQGAVVLWWTPEFSYDDLSGDGDHYLWYINSDYYLAYEYDTDQYSLKIGGQSVAASSNISAGTTYNLVANWDTKNPLSGSNYVCFTINNGTPACETTQPTASTPGSNIYIGSDGSSHSASGIIEGLTVYRRPLYDGTNGIDMGNGDEIDQINSGSGQDSTLITGSWDVVFALPTNASAGELSTTGQAWSHPHASNQLGGSNGKNGLMMDGDYTNDGLTDEGSPLTTDSIEYNGTTTTINAASDSGLDDLPTNAFTAEMWVRADTWGESGSQLYYKRGSNVGWNLDMHSSSGLRANIDFDGTDANSSSGTDDFTPDGGWHHVALTYNNSGDREAHLWIDGSEPSYAPIASSGSYVTTEADGILYIGNSEWNNLTVDGSIGWSRISNSVRYTTGFTPQSRFSPPAVDGNTVAQWNMSEGSGTNVDNAEGTAARDGTLSNGTWNDGGTIESSEKIYPGGYKWTNDAANEGLKWSLSSLSAGENYAVRAVAHSDGTSIPKIQIWDATNSAEITQMTGTTTSVRASPDTFLFTFELPTVARNLVASDCTSIEVRILNTQASGKIYWHQVELLTNIVDNPSLKTGSGDPWIPNGWINYNMDFGDSAEEPSDFHSGGSAIKFLNLISGEGLRGNPNFVVDKFYSVGAWGKRISIDGEALWAWVDNARAWQDSTLPQYPITTFPDTSWSFGGGVVRSTFEYQDTILLRAIGGDSIFDDIYSFPLDNVSLTVTAADVTNSTESTGLRVDGADTLTQPVLNIATSSGAIHFKYTPRHDLAVADKFGNGFSNTIAEFWESSSNYIALYNSSTTSVLLRGVFNSTTVEATWSSATLNAGTTYDIVIVYESGGNLVLYVDGVEKASQSGVVDFASVPATAYFGSDNTGQSQVDATYTTSIINPPWITLNNTENLFGSQAAEIVASGDQYLSQSLNLGDTEDYVLSAYVYNKTSGDSYVVNSNVVEFTVDGSTITTSYENIGSNWYRISASQQGANQIKDYGILIKDGKTIVLDDFTIKRDVDYSFYNNSAYENVLVIAFDLLEETSTNITGDNVEIGYQLCDDDGSTCQSGDQWQYWNGSSWGTTTQTDKVHTNTASELNSIASGSDRVIQLFSVTNKKISFKAYIYAEGESSAKISTLTVGLSTDSTPPSQNASNTQMKLNPGDTETVSEGTSINDDTPYFSWTAGEDNIGGVGLYGYCLYLGQDQNGDPQTTKGLLGTSPASTEGYDCPFITTDTSIDFSNVALQGATWLTSSTDSYYHNIKAIDQAGNVYSGDPESFTFKYDDQKPTNPTYISLPASFISNKNVTMTWPSSGGDSASDAHSGVAGLQYKIGNTGTWYGDNHTGTEDSDDLLQNDGSYNFVEAYDFDLMEEGSNIVYIRTWDLAGNVTDTYITGALKINTTAPSSPLNLNVSPSDNTVNEYGFTWDDPETYTGQPENITFCYTVNTLPSLTACNWTDAGVNSLLQDAYATQPGTNTFYIVAKDEAGNVNYATYASIVFTYSGSAPGIANAFEVSDISVKTTESWKLVTSWEIPNNIGAGIASYRIYRAAGEYSCSDNFEQFSLIGTTNGISFTDTELSQVVYSYCVKACDSANNCGAASSTSRIIPTGKFYEPANLVTAPQVVELSTKRARIEWATDRGSDSKVAYGLESQNYFEEEPSKSIQTVNHEIELINLESDTTYYYVAKWTDEDGNTGVSNEKVFKTDPAPIAKNISVVNVGLYSATVDFTTVGASKAIVFYGKTTSYGAQKEINTSAAESKYSLILDGLEDGTKYYYTIDTVDVEGSQYQSEISLDFTTLPRPRIEDVKIQQVRGTAQTTILVTWKSNTEVSSIVSFYPEEAPDQKQDEINTDLISGEHKMSLSGLIPETRYHLVVKGTDRVGNSAESDEYVFNTATDTRPPQISNVRVEMSDIPVGVRLEGEQTVQMIVSWDTDELATSQVEFGEGTGTTYSQKTKEDTTMTMKHVMVISGLTPSKVYHLRVISKDSADNIEYGIDTVTITPKATHSAFDLIVEILRDLFVF